MATADFPNEEIKIVINEDLITCQICMERFESPRMLPCQHTFCKTCIEAVIKKRCFGEHECNVFDCPVCRLQCKTGNGRTDMNVIMNDFPANRLMNELLEGIETYANYANTEAFNSNIDEECPQNASKKVQLYLWSCHCFLEVFRQYMHACFRLRWIKGQHLALHDAFINRKLASMFSDIVLTLFYKDNDDCILHQGIIATALEVSVPRNLNLDDRIQAIETIQTNTELMAYYFDKDLIDKSFVKEIAKSDWVKMIHYKDQCQQTNAGKLDLMFIAFRSLGFSNVFSISTLAMFMISKVKCLPRLCVLTTRFTQFQIKLLATLRVFGIIFLTHICGCLGWRMISYIVVIMFTVYLVMWIRPRNSRQCIHFQVLEISSGEIKIIPPISLDEFSLVGKITHSIIYVENLCRCVFICIALFKLISSFAYLPIVWIVVYDIVLEITQAVI